MVFIFWSIKVEKVLKRKYRASLDDNWLSYYHLTLAWGYNFLAFSGPVVVRVRDSFCWQNRDIKIFTEIFSQHIHTGLSGNWIFGTQRRVDVSTIVLLTGSWTSESARSAPGLKETTLTTARAAERRIASCACSCSSCCGYSSTTGCKKHKWNILQHSFMKRFLSHPQEVQHQRGQRLQIELRLLRWFQSSSLKQND